MEKLTLTVIKPRGVIETPEAWIKAYPALLELFARNCYKSEGKIDPKKTEKWLKEHKAHEGILEHAVISARIFCSRSCSHQLVRHRLASYLQESQRYCDYGNMGLQIICPSSIADLPEGQYVLTDGQWIYKNNDPIIRVDGISLAGVVPNGDERIKGEDGREITRLQLVEEWLTTMAYEYSTYNFLRNFGVKKEHSRSVLGNATKTEIIMTCNIRQWRYVINHRGLNPAAEEEIRNIFCELLEDLWKLMPCAFEDLQLKNIPF